MIRIEGESKKTGVAIAVAAVVDAVTGINSVSPTLLQRGLEAIKKGLQPKDYPEVIIVCDNMALGASIRLPGTNTIGLAVQGPDVPALQVDVPCVFNLPNLLVPISDGDIIVVDGHRGEIHIDPDPQTLIHYQQVEEEVETRQRIFLSSEHIPARTQNGDTVYVYAHCFSEHDVRLALDEGADGLIMDLRNSNTEDCYSEVLHNAAGKRVAFAVDYASDELLQAAARFAAAHQVSILFSALNYDLQMAGINPAIEEIRAEAHANDLDPPEVDFGIIAFEHEYATGLQIDEGSALVVDLREAEYPETPEETIEDGGLQWLAMRNADNTVVLIGENLQVLEMLVDSGARNVAVTPEAVGAAKQSVKLIGIANNEEVEEEEI